MRNRILNLLMVVGIFLLPETGIAQNNPITRVINGQVYIVHKVKAGDTYYKLSKKYQTAVADIQTANNQKALKVGDEVLIPSKIETATPPATVVQPVGQTQTHTVAKGETLNKIALQYKTTVDVLKNLNGLTNTNIRIGQILKVPAVGHEIPNPDPVVPKPVILNTVKPVVVDTAKTPISVPVKPQDVITPANPTNTTRVVLAETATEKEITGIAKISADSRLDPLRTFVLHPTLQKGSIIVVINESTGKMAYCRVVDNIKVSDMNGADILITPAIAEKIGMEEKGANVKIKFAVP